MRVTQAIDAFCFNRARILMKKELNMRRFVVFARGK